MINFRCVRVFVGRFEEGCPEHYTFRKNLDSLIGLKSENIHIHIDGQWFGSLDEHERERLQQMFVNLSMNSRPPVITVGDFDKRIHGMLIAMRALEI